MLSQYETELDSSLGANFSGVALSNSPSLNNAGEAVLSAPVTKNLLVSFKFWVMTSFLASWESSDYNLEVVCPNGLVSHYIYDDDSVTAGTGSLEKSLQPGKKYLVDVSWEIKYISEK